MMNFINQSNQNGSYHMNASKPLDINMSSMTASNNANYSMPSYHHQPQPQAMQSTFGPTRVPYLHLIQHSLRNPNISESQVLTLARQAILHGFIDNEKFQLAMNANIYICHRVRFNKMILVLTEGFDAVVTINWDSSQSQQLIGDNSTFQHNTVNTNQFNHQSSFVHNNSSPLRTQSVIQQQLQPQYQSHECKQQQLQTNMPLPPPPAQKLIDTTSVDSLGEEECMSEYDGIINEIIDCVNLDVDADPELTDFHDHDNEKLPPLPPQLTINTNTTFDGGCMTDYDSPIPATTTNPSHLSLPRVDRLKTQTSFYSINDDNQSELHSQQGNGSLLPPQRPQFKNVHSQNNVLFGGAESTSSAEQQQSGQQYNNINQYGIEVSISNALWNDLYHRFYNNRGFSSKQELTGMITNCIHQNRSPHQAIGGRQEWCVWIDTHYVYITETDMSTLVDVFPYSYFNNNNGQVLKQLNQRKYNIPSSAMKQHSSNAINQYIKNQNKSVYTHPHSMQRKLVKNASGRSILSNASSSKRSVFSNADNNHNNNKNNNKDANKKHEYHTIYLKPIIERMKAITYKMEGSSSKYSSIDSDYIIDIVDNSIKFGTKRQISKRTFEFKWQSYTIIMSKSLKTILDVTLSNEVDIITVHPDVVSIISKKCPQLDYFTIQKVAKQAKLKAAFTTKKNDYRQQFIYDYCGCRIVFASNHTTIVEMQCNDTSAINKAIRQ